MNSMSMPTPEGPHSIGFFDGSTTFTYEGELRGVGYRLFYPAKNEPDNTATYYPDGGMEQFCIANPDHPFTKKLEALAAVPTHCRLHASAASGSFPVLLYSHGLGTLPWHNLVQIEHLVSHGYIVMAAEHPGDTFYTRIGGQIIGLNTQKISWIMQQMVEQMHVVKKPDVTAWTNQDVSDYIGRTDRVAKTLQSWIADTLALCDELNTLNASGALAGKIDLSAIGAFGFSLGGACAINSALRDSRIGAAVNLDGWQMGGALLTEQLAVPGLYITKDARHYQGNYGTHNPGIAWLEIPQSNNLQYSDWGTFLDEEIKKIEPVQTEGKTVAAIMNDALLAFFNQHMRNGKDWRKIIAHQYSSVVCISPKDEEAV